MPPTKFIIAVDRALIKNKNILSVKNFELQSNKINMLVSEGLLNFENFRKDSTRTGVVTPGSLVEAKLVPSSKKEISHTSVRPYHVLYKKDYDRSNIRPKIIGSKIRHRVISFTMPKLVAKTFGVFSKNINKKDEVNRAHWIYKWFSGRWDNN